MLPLNWGEPFRLALVSQDIGTPLLTYQHPSQTEGVQFSSGSYHLLLAQQPMTWKGQWPFLWPGTSYVSLKWLMTRWRGGTLGLLEAGRREKWGNRWLQQEGMC